MHKGVKRMIWSAEVIVKGDTTLRLWSRKTGGIMKSNTMLVVSALVAGSMLMLSTSGASANEQNNGTDERQAATDFPVDVKPVADHLVIDGERVEVAVMPSFPSTGYVEILNGHTVEYGEIVDGGTIVTDRTAAKPVSPKAVASCNWTSWVAPATGNYVPTVQGCSFIGLNSSVQAGYEVVIGSASLGGPAPWRKDST